ncbi:MAG: hypothetical protein LBG11_01900, partial [Bifidobacteriaceae bacterium]|nr:hypothetical protein [Bifidobacteriaceae bacterium]
RGFFEAHPKEFFAFHRQYVLHPGAQPNATHRQLAALEKAGRLHAIVTQNIDGLHQAAGSRNVLELHGSVHRNHCRDCGETYPQEVVYRAKGIPRCQCGGMIEPDVVLYEDPLDGAVLAAASQAIAQADMLIIGGTSLVVYPAAGLVDYFSGDRLVVINTAGPGTPRRYHRAGGGVDSAQPLVICHPIGEVFARIEVEVARADG